MAAGKRVQSAPDGEPIARLVDAMASLGGDTDYLIDALTQKLRSLRPVSSASSLSKPEREFLIGSGAMTESELEGLMTAIWRGAVQLHEVQSWMYWILDTLSIEEAAGQLEMTDQELELAVRDRQVLSLTVAGRPRFPRWQFVTSPEGRLLPGLTALIAQLPSDEVLSSAAFMHAPMAELSGHGPRTPIQWLREGGDVEAVLELLRADEMS